MSTQNKFDNYPYLLEDPEGLKNRKIKEYSVDTNNFSTWPQKINTEKQYGEFKIKWVLMENQCWSVGESNKVSIYYSIEKLFCKKDTNNWFSLNESKYPTKEYIELFKAIKVRKQFEQKERAKKLSKERYAKLKTKAKNLGVTVKELQAQKRNEQGKNKFSCTKKDVERTKKLIFAGPVLKSLYDEINQIMNNIDNNPKKVNIKYLNRSLGSINKTISFLRAWNE